MTSSLEQEANEHVFGGARMLMGRGVSSRRLACVWMVFLLTRGEETLVEDASLGFFLHVDQSAW